MEDFRRQFLSESVETLNNLQRNLQNSKEIGDLIRHETFRTLHTVKGTAQTFGFGAASRLAHELESLLADDGHSLKLLIEGIALLRECLTEETFQIPPKFTEQIRAAVPNSRRISSGADDNPAEIPNEIYSQLSGREKTAVSAAIRGGKSLAVLEVGFEAANFAAELIKFREKLNASGEIIAAFPGLDFNRDSKIGFRFLTATAEAVEDSANVVWSFSPLKPARDIGEVLRQIERHGREIAATLDKQIEFETQIDSTNFSPAELKIIFEVLLHLIRNAVDHAIERVGKIRIQIQKDADGFRLSVADDGRGIDAERIKARAIEKNLISDDNLSETETINLIFQPEFSTKSETTEISGRGIGLDAVKYAVEKFGGTVKVVTEKGKGTTFEIYLPHTNPTV